MIWVHREALYRKYYAPFLSGATVFFFLAHALTIIAAFLTAYYTHGLWIKEATYREQPRVSYAHTCAVKLQGLTMPTNSPFELAFSTIPSVNDMAEQHVRVPTIRVLEEDYNLDLIADVIKIELEFPVQETERVSHVQGVFMFQYEVHNRVRLSMETPVSLDYGAGVPGSALLVDGYMRLKAANPMSVRSAVRGKDLEALLDRSALNSISEVSFHTLISKGMRRNETTVLDPVLSSWEVQHTGCANKCTFTLSLTLHVPNEQIAYVPTFVEVCKFSWIQFITTVIFLRLFINPLLNFIAEQQIVQTLPRDPRKLEKYI